MLLDELTKEAVRRCLDAGIPNLREAIEPILSQALGISKLDLPKVIEADGLPPVGGLKACECCQLMCAPDCKCQRYSQ